MGTLKLLMDSSSMKVASCGGCVCVWKSPLHGRGQLPKQQHTHTSFEPADKLLEQSLLLQLCY